jgi:hypothetical protein
MWRLETTRAVYAVKEINRDFGNPGYVPWYERAFRAEMTAFHAGVPMPRPVPVPATGGCLAELPGTGAHPTTVRLHDWVDATPLRNPGYTTAQARWIGATLAQIHTLRIAPDEPEGSVWHVFGEAYWSELTSRAEDAATAWAPGLRERLGIIAELEAYVVASRADLGPLIMSHRDVDQKNVLVAPDGALMLVDWDATGAVSARHELANAALVWGRGDFDEPQAEFSRALVDGYRDAGGEYDAPRPSDFAEFVCGMIHWFEYNVRRTLGERLHDETDRQLADREARHVLGQLARFAGSLEAWAHMLA